MASLKSELTCKLIYRMPGECLLISRLQGSALRSMLNRSTSLAIQKAFSKSCLVNLIPKDTHLVFSVYISFTWRFDCIMAVYMYVWVLLFEQLFKVDSLLFNTFVPLYKAIHILGQIRNAAYNN